MKDELRRWNDVKEVEVSGGEETTVNFIYISSPLSLTKDCKPSTSTPDVAQIFLAMRSTVFMKTGASRNV